MLEKTKETETLQCNGTAVASGPTQFFADQLTLSRPGVGAHYPNPVLRAPPPRIFRPCDGPVVQRLYVVNLNM